MKQSKKVNLLRRLGGLLGVGDVSSISVNSTVRRPQAVRVSADKALELTRLCRDNKVPSPVTVNSRGQLVINPAVSEAQRRYLNATFGHDWVKEHEFDNHGSLPEYVATKNAQRMAGTCTANEANFFGRFWSWITGNRRLVANDPAVPMRSGVAATPVARAADGTFGMGGRGGVSSPQEKSPGAGEDDPDQEEADERGLSPEEVRAARGEGESKKGGGKKPVKNRRRLVTNAREDEEECPECGGKMEEDEEGDMRCEKCGYVENLALVDNDGGRAVDDTATDRLREPKGGNIRPDGRYNDRLSRQTPIDVVDDDGDPALDEDDHSEHARDKQIAMTQNAFPQRYSGPDPHSATKQAVAATVMTGHDDAHEPAVAAMKSSAEDDPEAAADSHLEAADAHEGAATEARADGSHADADDHDAAAAMHRKAASMHKAVMSFNQRTATRNTNQGRRSTMKVKPLTRNEWIRLLLNDPVLTANMPAGGAFEGAKASGYSAAQAAAMAGKLEGSYGGSSGIHKEAKDASAHAERTKSKSAHKKASAKHKESAQEHEKVGRVEPAKAARTASRSHAAKAARMTRNEYIEGLIENCTCADTRRGLAALITNEPDALGEEGGALYAGRQEEDDEPAFGEDDDRDYPEKVSPKKNKMATNAYLAQMPPDLREVFNEGLESRDREKRHLVHRLVANVRNPARRELRIQELMGKSASELRGLLELVGNREPSAPDLPPEKGGDGGGEVLLFGPGDTTIIDNQGVDDDLTLDCPTINFKPRNQTA